MSKPCPGPPRDWRGGGRAQQLTALRKGKHPRDGTARNLGKGTGEVWAPRRTHTLAPPDGPARHATHSCIIWRVLENTGALEQRHVGATERVGGGWVGGVAGG